MYERFYGLRERAFELTPDPRFLLLTRGHREALSNVNYGIAYKRGFTLVLGEAGTGKTTILRKALAAHKAESGGRLEVIHINNPRLTRDEFLELVAQALGLPAGASTSKARFLVAVESALSARSAAGDGTVLVVDEAQTLPDDLLEELRLLGNIESDTQKLLPLILAGQPEFGVRLNQPHLRQLKQRIALRCTLMPLSVSEVAAYVAGRIRLAGGDPGTIFTRDAIVAIARHSRGIPRTISVICDNALLSGVALERRPIDEGLVEEVCRDFDLVAAGAVPPSLGGSTPPEREPRPEPSKIRQFVAHGAAPAVASPSAMTRGAVSRAWSRR